MTDVRAVEQSFGAIYAALNRLDEPGGSALRDHYALQSTRDGDREILSSVGAGSRMNMLIGARAQLSRSLGGGVSSGLADLVARVSALTGESPVSPEVCRTLASRVGGVDAADLPALLSALSGVQPAGWARWSAYDIWNESLIEEFFSGSRAGRPVYLDLEADVVERLTAAIGAPAGAAAPDATRAFSRSVVRTFEFRLDGPPMLREHVRKAVTWAASAPRGDGGEGHPGIRPPPFIAALGLFSLAAESMRSGEGMRATNYYGRLCERLEVGSDAVARKVQNDFRRHANRLWAHLNAWLRRAHGARGIPTAEAFDHRVYVSIPISQALVRAADRDRLSEFFSAYQLNPGQQFSRLDMREILAAWLPGSHLSASLKSLWRSSQEARRRIADVVCIELEHWDGTAPPEHSSSQRHFDAVLAASYEEVPFPEFSIALVVRDEGDVPDGRYRFDDGSALPGFSGAVHAVRESGGLIRLQPATPQSMGNGLLNSVLRHPLGLAHESRPATISRPSRSVVVFLMDESRGLFTESARVELGREHFILVRNGLAAQVRGALGEIARPGYRALSGVAGVPDGWMLYIGVHVRSLLTGASEALTTLVPLSTTQVDLTGGMQLSAGRWHSSSPPDVMAVDAAGRRFAVSLFDESGTSGEFVATPLGTHSGEARISLRELGLVDGNYRIVLNETTPSGGIGSHLTSRGLRLRSAESAHLDPPTDVCLAHQAGPSPDGWTALSATSLDVSSTAAIRGAAISGTEAGPRPVPPVRLPARLGRSVSVSDVGSLSRLFPRAHPAAIEAELEQLMRLHLVSVDDGKPRLTPAGYAYANEGLKSSGRAVTRAGTTPPDEIASRFEADLDLILDALGATGGGTWRSLEQLIRYSSVERWEPLEAARNLSALGYIDLELDHHSQRPLRWSAAPATMVVLPDGLSAFIAGARSEPLLQRVEAEARQLGGSMFRHERGGRPVLVQVHGLQGRAFETVAQRASLACVRDVPRRIAQMLPAIRDVYRERPEFYPPQGASIEQFDFGTNTWRDVERIELSGAYRITADTRHYAALADDGLRECGNAVSKYAGAAATGRSIMSYSVGDERLTCLLGARPPGLYERVLVLCTGELPRSLSDGTSVYEGVPPGVAAWLAASLGPHSWETGS